MTMLVLGPGSSTTGGGKGGGACTATGGGWAGGASWAMTGNAISANRSDAPRGRTFMATPRTETWLGGGPYAGSRWVSRADRKMLAVSQNATPPLPCTQG